MPTKHEELDIHSFLGPDDLAVNIANKWTTWDGLRAGWKERQLELRNYIYAESTRTTGDKVGNWTNSTTIPKLTQIYDNLKANYTAALFPRENWLSWVPMDKNAASKRKATVAKQYIKNKLDRQQFERVADQLIDDFIMGNCFATVEWVDEGHVIHEGTPMASWVPTFNGPRIVRVSPYDIVFNPTATSFEASPKIIRSLVSLGGLIKMGYSPEVIERIRKNRSEIQGFSTSPEKTMAFVADGFADINQYYSSGYVELLTFYGDIYDDRTGTLREKRKVVIVDRAYVLSDEPISSWLGESPVYHAAWRSRPDNLYGMSPLENLVGMQYRLDHLENLRADIFDMIALPMLLVKGEVHDFEYAPGEHIRVGDDGEVAFLQPQALALNADNQMMLLSNTMEDFAGAPRQAMGIRTPGEKTAFEVQTLNDNASRIFQHKTAKFEREFLEPILNAMLSAARENMATSDVISVLDDKLKVELFMDITKEDLASRGTIRPIGARNFAEKMRRTTELTTLIQIKQDQSIAPHLSGKAIAKLLSEEIGREELFGENIMVHEMMETQSVAQDAEAEHLEELAIKQELGE